MKMKNKTNKAKNKPQRNTPKTSKKMLSCISIALLFSVMLLTPILLSSEEVDATCRRNKPKVTTKEPKVTTGGYRITKGINGYYSVQLIGVLKDKGEADYCQVFFQYGTWDNYDDYTTKPITKYDEGSFGCTLNLKRGQTIFFGAVAVNSFGTSYGQFLKVKT